MLASANPYSTRVAEDTTPPPPLRNLFQYLSFGLASFPFIFSRAINWNPMSLNFLLTRHCVYINHNQNHEHQKQKDKRSCPGDI